MASIGTLIPNPWVRVLDALEKKVNRSSYETWLKPTRFSHSQGPVLFVRVPNPDFCHIGEKWGDLISEAIDDLGMEYQDVEFVTDQEKQNAARKKHEQMVSPKRKRLMRPRQAWFSSSVLTGMEQHN